MELQTIDSLYMRLISLIKELQRNPNNPEAQKQEKIALHQLFFIFGPQMKKALILLDQKDISKYQCEIMKQSSPLMSVYKINQRSESLDKQDKAYLVFISENGAKYCNCEDYVNNIICDSNNIICNHILAALLSEAYAEYKIIIVDLNQYLNLCTACC
ncbi:hypothetical protein ABPG74_022418 [Tetrahymena malaccensis]